MNASSSQSRTNAFDEPAMNRRSSVVGGRWSAALLSALLLLPCAFCSAATYYVSPTGSDTNSGTQAAPFRQIRRGITAAAAGDTILVADGGYLGFDIDSKSGTTSAPITIRATGTAAQVNPTTDRSDNRDTMLITFANYWVLDGLRSFNGNRSAIRLDTSHHITVRNGV